jgi:D-amino peptidase
VYRRLLTAEVNAAIEGALEAGVQEVLVNDGHATARNLVLEEMHPTAEVLSGYPKPQYMVAGMAPGFDAAFFVGYHGSAGTQDAILPHTYAPPRIVYEVRLNGAVQSEGSLNGYFCGAFDCPVALFTGDSAAVSEMHTFCLEVEGVVVKDGYGAGAARSLQPTVACERIRTGARRAIERLATIAPMRPPAPAALEIDFVRPIHADSCERIPGVRRESARTVSWRGGDYVEALRVFQALVDLARAADP